METANFPPDYMAAGATERVAKATEATRQALKALATVCVCCTRFHRH